MNQRLKIIAYRSLLGIYAASVVEDNKNENVKSEKWFKNAYKVYRKCRGMKKIHTTADETRILKAKLNQIQDLEDKHFKDGYWNVYSLVVMCLEHLVYQLNFTELKGLLIDLEVEKTRTMLETDKEYKELNKVSNRYFAEILEIIGD